MLPLLAIAIEPRAINVPSIDSTTRIAHFRSVFLHSSVSSSLGTARAAVRSSSSSTAPSGTQWITSLAVQNHVRGVARRAILRTNSPASARPSAPSGTTRLGRPSGGFTSVRATPHESAAPRCCCGPSRGAVASSSTPRLSPVNGQSSRTRGHPLRRNTTVGARRKSQSGLGRRGLPLPRSPWSDEEGMDFRVSTMGLPEPTDRVFVSRTAGGTTTNRRAHRPRARSVGAMFDPSAAAVDSGDRGKLRLVRSAARIVIGPPWLADPVLPSSARERRANRAAMGLGIQDGA
jgi:hypothetical protein